MIFRFFSFQINISLTHAKKNFFVSKRPASKEFREESSAFYQLPFTVYGIPIDYLLISSVAIPFRERIVGCLGERKEVFIFI